MPFDLSPEDFAPQKMIERWIRRISFENAHATRQPA
jgi:hypothetical protein